MVQTRAFTGQQRYAAVYARHAGAQRLHVMSDHLRTDVAQHPYACATELITFHPAARPKTVRLRGSVQRDESKRERARQKPSDQTSMNTTFHPRYIPNACAVHALSIIDAPKTWKCSTKTTGARDKKARSVRLAAAVRAQTIRQAQRQRRVNIHKPIPVRAAKMRAVTR